MEIDCAGLHSKSLQDLRCMVTFYSKCARQKIVTAKMILDSVAFHELSWVTKIAKNCLPLCFTEPKLFDMLQLLLSYQVSGPL